MRASTPLLLCVTLAAAACATKPPKAMRDDPVATTADLHRIKVEQAGERMEVPVGASGALTPEDSALISGFGAYYRELGHGPLLLSTPTGAGDSDAAARLAQAARLKLVEDGVPFAAIAGGTYDAAGKASAPLVLSFTRYTAEAPECAPVWSVDLSDNKSNQPPKTFGCFMNANLAAMISDPADLDKPRDIEPRDAARRDVVWGKYREGAQTHAERTEDESAIISEAIRK